MKRWFQISVCLLAALHLVGGHWGVLQMVAWAQMINDYSKGKSVVLAVKETFDGEHPCPMCLKIKEGKQQESKEKPLPQSKTEKLSPWLAALPLMDLPTVVWHHNDSMKVFASMQIIVSQWATAPPTPPPRCGAAFSLI